MIIAKQKIIFPPMSSVYPVLLGEKLPELIEVVKGLIGVGVLKFTPIDHLFYQNNSDWFRIHPFSICWSQKMSIVLVVDK
jgi:hypothetical protein